MPVVWWLLEMATVAVFALGWWPCCCYYMISCGACANGTVRDEMQVEISGMTDDDCTGSANWNGTWIVAFVSDSGGSCTWQYILSAAQRTNHRVAVGLTPTCEASANSYVNLSVIKSGTDYHWLVSLNDLDASVNLNQYAWVGNIQTSPIDCEFTDDTPGPSTRADSTHYAYDNSGATCLATAI